MWKTSFSALLQSKCLLSIRIESSKIQETRKLDSETISDPKFHIKATVTLVDFTNSQQTKITTIQNTSHARARTHTDSLSLSLSPD